MSALARVKLMLHDRMVRLAADGGHHALFRVLEVVNDIGHHDWTMLKWLALYAALDWLRKDNRMERLHEAADRWIRGVGDRFR